MKAISLDPLRPMEKLTCYLCCLRRHCAKKSEPSGVAADRPGPAELLPNVHICPGPVLTTLFLTLGWSRSSPSSALEMVHLSVSFCPRELAAPKQGTSGPRVWAFAPLLRLASRPVRA